MYRTTPPFVGTGTARPYENMGNLPKPGVPTVIDFSEWSHICLPSNIATIGRNCYISERCKMEWTGTARPYKALPP